MENKVTFGLRNVHFATVVNGTDGSITYDGPKKLPGAVSLTINPVGERSEFFADNIAYHIEETNNGYDGELAIAQVTDEFKTGVLGETLETGVMYETSNQKGKKFALLFEFEGDQKAKRHVLYFCSASRPTVGSTTKTNSTEVQPTTLTFSSRPRPTDNMIKANTTTGLDAATYDAWYTAVHEKPAPAPTV
jgi:phi13 family phage major tail protein